MKKHLPLFICLLFAPIIASGQMVINNFNTLPEPDYFTLYDNGDGKSWVNLSLDDVSLYQQPDDTASGTIILDDFTLEGVAPNNLVFFNGKTVPTDVYMHVGWSGSVIVTDEEAATPGTNSIKWMTGSWWDGVEFDLANPMNLQYNWSTDSVQLKIKAPAGIGDLRLIFSDPDEDGADTTDFAFEAVYLLSEADVGFDGTWKQVKVALKDFNRFNGVWDPNLGTVIGPFDSTKIVDFRIGGSGQSENWGANTYTIYLDDIWTGNPEFDWGAPVAVTGVDGVPEVYYNLVIWQDVPGEEGETYNVYASKEPITDVTAQGVDVVAKGIIENTQTAVHWICYPLVDTDVTYYYAVNCVDKVGNGGSPGVSDAVVNTAKGVPTISLNPPATFAADSDLSEWDASGIMPWVLKPETDNVAAGEIADSTDLKATVYLAMDEDYFYVAFDVIDDVFAYSATEGNWWNWDAFEFYIGLYDWRGPTKHAAMQRGAEPDYKLVFQQDRLFNEFRSGSTPVYTPEDENYYFEEFGGADYVAEAKIPFDSIAFGDDVRFHPVRGMRIPFELYFHDNDGTTPENWEGNLAYSPYNTDLAWQTPREWTYTWIGDTTHVTGVEGYDKGNVVNSYELAQNYPNPFNPTTTIHYSLPKGGQVKIELFNMLGQMLRTLVDERKPAGRYKTKFNAENLSSGIYFYRIQAGRFAQTRKMILMK